MSVEMRTLAECASEGGIFSDGDWVESKDQDPDGEVRLIQLADVGDGAFRNRSNRFLTREKAAELGCTYLEPGDILIARMPEPLGRACIFPAIDQPAVTAVDVCILRPGPDVAPHFVMHMINSPQFRAQIASLQSGTTRRRISRKNLATIRLPVPDLDIQMADVQEMEKQFTRLDAALSNLQQTRTKMGRYRAAVLQAAASGTLVGERSWPTRTLGSVAEIRGGILKNPRRKPRYNHFPFLRVANVLNQALDLSEVHRIELFEGELEKWRLRKGDLLIVEGNGSPKQIGRMAIWKGDIDDCVHQNHLVRARPHEVLSEWIAICWNSPAGRENIRAVASSTSGLYTLSAGKVAKLQIPFPPLDTQREIVAEVDRLLSVLKAFEAQVDTDIGRGGTLRSSILSKAFTDKLGNVESGVVN